MRPYRESIDLDRVKHNAPIPMGARVGNMFFSSGIPGRDPETGEWPSDPRQQARNCFENLRQTLSLAGGSMGDVGHMTVFITDNGMRAHVNEFWLESFPNERDRPARHILVQPLPDKVLVQIEVIAVLRDATA